MSTIAEIITDLDRAEGVYLVLTDQWVAELKSGCGCKPRDYDCLSYIIDSLNYRVTVETVPSDITEKLYTEMLLIIGSAVIKYPPTVNAGADQTKQASQSAVFNAVATQGSAPITSYLWTKVSGGSVLMTGTTTSQLTVSGTIGGMPLGQYEFKITVTDGNGLTASDTVKLTVTANNITILFGYSSSPINPATFAYQGSKSIVAGATSYEVEFPLEVLTGDVYISISEPQSEPEKFFWYNTALNQGELGTDFIMNDRIIVNSRGVYNSTGIFTFDGNNRKLKLSVNGNV